jgi:hypothetical protein
MIIISFMRSLLKSYFVEYISEIKVICTKRKYNVTFPCSYLSMCNHTLCIHVTVNVRNQAVSQITWPLPFGTFNIDLSSTEFFSFRQYLFRMLWWIFWAQTGQCWQCLIISSQCFPVYSPWILSTCMEGEKQESREENCE